MKLCVAGRRILIGAAAVCCVMSVGLCESGCASSQPAILRPARVALNAASDAIAMADAVEIKRIRTAAEKSMAACGGDVACRKEAVSTVFAAEATNLARLEELALTQGELASALVAFENCKGQPESQLCEASALAALEPLLPVLQKLVAETKGLAK